MSSAEINYLTASEALELFRSKKLSPVEYLRAIIAQCEPVNPKVNAFTYTFFDRALEQAKAAEARYAKGDGVRPLEGSPSRCLRAGSPLAAASARRELMKT